MKKFVFGLGMLSIILCVAEPSFANSSQNRSNRPALKTPIEISQQADTSATLSVVVNPEFDEFVRRNSYIATFYDLSMWTRLTSLARRQMTLMEQGTAIDEILSSQ